jgi:hypothetical protein
VRGVLYKLTDGANGTGIDSVWRAEGHNDGKPYAIVEAKASVLVVQASPRRRQERVQTMKQLPHRLPRPRVASRFWCR